MELIYIFLTILTILLICMIILINEIGKQMESKNYTKINYQYLLESPQKYYFGKEDIDAIDLNNELVKTMNDFCIKNKIYKNGAIISLSGGVDSMVITAILLKLAKIHKFDIFACSLNYNLRDEQRQELEFIEQYCYQNNIYIYTRNVKGYSRKKDDSGPRTEFEEESRKVRFDMYKEIIKEYGCTGVFVGHHKDDIIENIFTNSMKGGNLLDLEVMKEISNIQGVNIYRPLLEYHKDKIYELSHKHNIPYFLDTTPKWSRRGKMRNEIFPLFDNVFSISWRVKLKDLGEQSNQWGNYINEYVINPWFKEIIFGKYGFYMKFKEQPKLIYINVLVKSMHKIGHHMLKSSSLDKILEAKDKKIYNKLINLDSGFSMFIDEQFKDGFIIFNFNSLQACIDYNPVQNISVSNDKENYLVDFVNGIITYKQPKNVGKTYSINKEKYKQMDTISLCNSIHQQHIY